VETPSRPTNGFFFEDYAVGQHFKHATPRTITSGDSAMYIALTGARQPLHCAATVAQALGYADTPVDDLLVFHIAFGKTVPDISYNAVANLGYADCQFFRAVFVGDTIRCETEIVGLKQNSSGKTGVVYVRSHAFNQHDQPVVTWARWVMVHRRKEAHNVYAPNEEIAPQGKIEFKTRVPTYEIHAHRSHHADTILSVATGSQTMWDDIDADFFEDDPLYDVAKKTRITSPIKHPAGMTIEESDHMLATRLYQNTARVHFDLHHMKDSRFGRRLVYGGHVISICRALSYDGLENVVSIAAINAGTHHNPTFAGDTLYAVSNVISKWAVNDNLGGVRIVLEGYKNVDPNSPSFANVREEDKVLSLDYAVLMPRRK
jgi:2-methylfumaryl-CoA hydratase